MKKGKVDQVDQRQPHGKAVAAILGNPAMVEAYKAGIPENGKPFPDGAKMAKVYWAATTNENASGKPTVGGTQLNMDFMATW